MVEVEAFYLILHPRPAYAIGSGRVGEVVNFMAASWVTPVAEEPPRAAVAIDVESYTHELISKYGEFTINVLPMERVDVLYGIGSVSGRDVDKVAKYGVEAAKGRAVEAPIIADAVGVLECKVTARVESEDTTLFVGDVVAAYANEEYFSERRGWATRKIDIPLHNWGRGFYRLGRLVMASRK